jgi:hypothetical protein
VIAVAEMLGKFPHEVEELPCDEFDNILLFMRYRTEEQKKASKKANAKKK